jgi:hypothetical protein
MICSIHTIVPVTRAGWIMRRPINQLQERSCLHNKPINQLQERSCSHKKPINQLQERSCLHKKPINQLQELNFSHKTPYILPRRYKQSSVSFEDAETYMLCVRVHCRWTQRKFRSHKYVEGKYVHNLQPGENKFIRWSIGRWSRLSQIPC